MHQNTTAIRLLSVLDAIFADRGLPTVIVSDNGPQFTSDLFKEHMKNLGVKHVLTPPYHPASNGSAERAVGCLKQALYKMDAPAATPGLQAAITKFLEMYRSAPHTTTHISPHEMMKGHAPRTKFSLLKPSHVRDLEKKHQQQVLGRDGSKSVVLRTFSVGNKVLVYNTLTHHNDIGEIVSVQGRNTYKVRVGDREKLVSADHISHTQARNSTQQTQDGVEGTPASVSENEVLRESDSDSDEDVPHVLSELEINGSGQDNIGGAIGQSRKVRAKRSEINRISNNGNIAVTNSRTRESNKNKTFTQYR